MLVTPTFGEQYDGIDPPTGSDKAPGLVDVALHSHLDAAYMPRASLSHLEQWAARVDPACLWPVEQSSRSCVIWKGTMV